MYKNSISKKLLVQFLKKENMMGEAIVSIISKPFLDEEESTETNLSLIDKYCFYADSCETRGIRKQFLKSILGATRIPQYKGWKVRDDFLIVAYRKWFDHIENNSEKINGYYKDNKTIH